MSKDTLADPQMDLGSIVQVSSTPPIRRVRKCQRNQLQCCKGRLSQECLDLGPYRKIGILEVSNEWPHGPCAKRKRDNVSGNTQRYSARPTKSQPSLASRASQNLGLRAPWKPIRSAAAALPNQISLPGGKLN